MAAAIDVRHRPRGHRLLRRWSTATSWPNTPASSRRCCSSPRSPQSDFKRNKEPAPRLPDRDSLREQRRAARPGGDPDRDLRGPPLRPPRRRVRSRASSASRSTTSRPSTSEHYTQANLMLGVAGGYPEGLRRRAAARPLGALPQGEPRPTAASCRRSPKSRAATSRSSRRRPLRSASTSAIPLPITRADADYYPLMVANSFLGEHRTFHGRLMQQLRGARGLNYGDYSYIEYWPQPAVHQQPDAGRAAPAAVLLGLDPAGGAGGRPVRPARRALRGAAPARQRPDEGGVRADPRLPPQLHEALGRRACPTASASTWTAVLRHALLSSTRSTSASRAMTVEEVNAAVKKYLTTGRTTTRCWSPPTPPALKDGAPEGRRRARRPTTARSQPEVAEADKTIQALPVKPTAIEIVPVDQVFQK